MRLFIWRIKYCCSLFYILRKKYRKSVKNAFIMSKAEFGCLGKNDIVRDGVWESAYECADSEAEELYYTEVEDIE